MLKSVLVVSKFILNNLTFFNKKNMDISRFIVRLTIGLFFIFLGLSLFLDQLGFVNSFWSTVFNLWPLLLVIWGILFLIKRKLVAALFLLFFGVAFLLSNFFNISICSVW